MTGVCLFLPETDTNTFVKAFCDCVHASKQHILLEKDPAPLRDGKTPLLGWLKVKTKRKMDKFVKWTQLKNTKSSVFILILAITDSYLKP